MILSSPVNDRYFHECFSQRIVCTFEILSCSPTNFAEMSNIFFSVRSVVFTMEFWLSWKFFHTNVSESIATAINIHQIIECSSPSPATLKIFLSFSHLIIHSIHEWCWFYRQFQFCCIASHDEILRICHFLRIDIIRSPRSFTKCFSVPYGLRVSVGKNFFMMRANLLNQSPRSFIRLPWSIVCRSLSSPLLRRPSTVVIQFWIICWREAHKQIFFFTRLPWSIFSSN